MNIITVPDLDPAFRLYACPSGRYIRVKAVMNAQNEQTNSLVFHISCEEADETGAALGAVMSPMALSIVQTEANISPFSYEIDFPLNPEDGQLVVIADRLHEYLEAAWHDRGPVAGTITAPMAEMIAALDRTARGLLVQADRLFERRGASHDMASYLGQTYSTVNDL